MSPKNLMTRREIIKTLGAGAALTGLGLLSTRAGLVENSRPDSLKYPFTLPPLGYEFNALEPHIDSLTMSIHHDKHHQGYVNNANKAMHDYPELQGMGAAQVLANLKDVPEAIRGSVRNNVGGHANHSFFWKIIGPGAQSEPEGILGEAIIREFGTVGEFRTKFAQAAMQRFGSGWAWLSMFDGGLSIHSTPNQDSPISEGKTPLLGLDVWEHAYYLHYQNRRADYVNAFWSIVDWRQVEANYLTAV
jgi:superoxide dismutase, Fe-Mn family|uniref:superoxide dismutase n=1 Tax=Cephaloticoccus sp. TaxID=1985742 RepID=UPI004049ED4C